MVFGQVVDDAKLDTMPRYAGKPKTQEDRAIEAINLKYADNKYKSALDRVEGSKNEYDNGVTTKCLVYNATGETLRYSACQDWYGSIGHRDPYPTEIGNGQWASFLHVHNAVGLTGSEAAVVFTGMNRNGHWRDFLLAWDTPWSSFYTNKAYSDVANEGYFNSHWTHVKQSLENNGKIQSTNKDGIVIDVSTGSGTSPLFQAIIKIN